MFTLQVLIIVLLSLAIVCLMIGLCAMRQTRVNQNQSTGVSYAPIARYSGKHSRYDDDTDSLFED